MGSVANFICFQAVQKFWKSVKIWQSYREFKGGNFSWDTVYKCYRYQRDNAQWVCLFAAVSWTRWPQQQTRVPRSSAVTLFRRRCPTWRRPAHLSVERRPPLTASTAAARPTPSHRTARSLRSRNVDDRWSSPASMPTGSTAAAWRRTPASGQSWRQTAWTAAAVGLRASASMTICSCHFHTALPLTASADCMPYRRVILTLSPPIPLRLYTLCHTGLTHHF